MPSIPTIIRIAIIMTSTSSLPPAMSFLLYVLPDLVYRNQECDVEYDCSGQCHQS